MPRSDRKKPTLIDAIRRAFARKGYLLSREQLKDTLAVFRSIYRLTKAEREVVEAALKYAQAARKYQSARAQEKLMQAVSNLERAKGRK